MKKLWIAAACCLLLGTAYAVDYGISKQYEYELIGASSDTFVADGQSTVKITVKLTKDGRPVEGHTIYLYVSNGFLPSSRCVTDADGLITFRYYPYLYLMSAALLYIHKDCKDQMFFLQNPQAMRPILPILQLELLFFHSLQNQ